MRFVTFVASPEPRLGVLGEGDTVLDLRAAGFEGPGTMQTLIDGGPQALQDLRHWIANETVPADCWLDVGEVTLLAPIPAPRKNIYCVGRNYKLHIEESARAKGIPLAFPKVPEFFSKPATAVVGHGAGIRRNAALTDKLDYEVELAIVLGRTIRDATADEALGAIFGYTIVNDISARDLQMGHGQWFKGKALDTYCPIGPCIVTADEFGDAAGHRIALRVNGETRQDSTTSDLLFDVAAIISSLSAGQTLHAGDMIATGTPSGVAFGMEVPRYLQVGDIIEAEVEGIGILRNTIVD